MWLQVFANLWVDQHQILMATVATALLEIGYEIEVITYYLFAFPAFLLSFLWETVLGKYAKVIFFELRGEEN